MGDLGRAVATRLYDNGGMTSLPGNFNPYGAVDLAALAKQREAKERAEAAREGGSVASPAAAAAPNVFDVSDVTFDVDVVQRSMLVPVVIDFWADWCGPCKQLSPILERFAEQDGGTWVLAKVDVDANPQLSAAAQVQSIPTVMVVWQGQVIPGFAGALPESQVRDFLNQVIALSGEVAEGVPEAEPAIDPELAAADSALEHDDLDGAAAAYEQILAERPGDPDATQGLAQVRLLQRTEGQQRADVVAAAAANPTDVAAQTLASDVDLMAGDVDAAFDRLLSLVGAVDGDARDQAKSHLLGLLDLVGNEDPRVLAARRRLASALF